MATTYGIELLKKSSVQSFWSNFFGYSDPHEGAVWRRPSTQKTDTFPRLGAAPFPQEWGSDKNPKDVNEYSYSITNKPFEATVGINKELIQFEQWDEIGNLVGNLGMKARAHPIKLLSDALNNGHATAGDDGQFFFDTDHADPGAVYTTSQNNDLTANISTPLTPSDIELRNAVGSMFDFLYGTKDDRGDPFVVVQADAAANFVIECPTNGYQYLRRILVSDTLDTGTGVVGNPYKGAFTLRINPFLTAWTSSSAIFFMLYTGSSHKPLILNVAAEVALTDNIGSDDHFKSGDVQYSATWWGREAYGQWRTAVRYEFT